MDMLFTWELIGAVSIFFVGALLHFAFDLFGRWRPLALVLAANESTWEHNKLCFWPGLLFAAIEYSCLGISPVEFWAAKGISLFTMPFIISIVFHTYVLIVGRHYLAANILLFLIAVAAGQGISYLLLSNLPMGPLVSCIGLCMMAVLTIAFCVFTFFPPRIFLFRDPVTKEFGIPSPAPGGDGREPADL